jgi:hypothetical protein
VPLIALWYLHGVEDIIGKSGLEKDVKSGNIIKAAAKALGGGGGKPDLALLLIHKDKRIKRCSID